MGWRSTTLTILSGATESEELNLADQGAIRVKSLTFWVGTLPETVTVHLAPVLGGTYRALQSGGGDITLPASRATQVSSITAGALKLVAGGAVAADRVFTVKGAATQS